MKINNSQERESDNTQTLDAYWRETSSYMSAWPDWKRLSLDSVDCCNVSRDNDKDLGEA